MSVEDQDSAQNAIRKAVETMDAQLGTVSTDGLVEPPGDAQDSHRISLVKLGKLLETTI